MPMTQEQIVEFTKRPLLAVLATIYPSGAPQAVPVWYEYDGEHFIVTTAEDRVKVKNVRRDPRVTLCIVDTSVQSQGLVVRGRAEVVEEGTQEATARLARRHVGPERAERMTENFQRQKRVILRITPERILQRGQM